MPSLLLPLLACTDPATGPATSGPAVDGSPPPPRILLVTLDTTRADHLGAWGGSPDITPAIDRFAEGALRFTRAHAHAPWTKPSIATLMTSRLPRDHGLAQWEDQLPEDLPTLATTLDAAGWATEAVVAHSAFVPEENRFHLGFDRFDLSWRSQPGGADTAPKHLETSTHLTNLAIAALARLQAGPDPFLLWVHYFDPHNDFLHHDDHVHLGDEPASVYAEEVAWTDRELGRLLRLAESDPHLIVAVLADHGEEWLDHGGLGHAHTVYEELIHVPLALRAPGIPPGVVDAPVGLIDLAPTLLDRVGVPIPPTFRGRPLWPEPDARRVFAETERIGDARTLIAWPYKIVWDLVAGRGELFHLEDDPGEQVDLFDQEPARAQRMLEDLAVAYPEIGLPGGDDDPGRWGDGR